jgi:hypothetical protein
MLGLSHKQMLGVVILSFVTTVIINKVPAIGKYAA